MICNRDCFNCKYSDCVNDDLSKSDYLEQQERDFDFGLRHHSSEKEKEKARQYYWEHREQKLVKNREYYNTHKEKFKEYDRIRKQTHPVTPEKRHEYYIHWRDKKKGIINGN